jgi:hypothetical protein
MTNTNVGFFFCMPKILSIELDILWTKLGRPQSLEQKDVLQQGTSFTIKFINIL